MKNPMHAFSVDLFSNILGNLSWLLDRAAKNAASRKIEPSVFLNARLSPDMLPLSRQIQIAGDIAKNSVSRLAATELRARLARTIDYLKSLPPAAFEGAETRDIKVPAGERTLEFKGLEFLETWAIPNVFFHVTTAYAILRHNGVDLGNKDFIGGGREM